MASSLISAFGFYCHLLLDHSFALLGPVDRRGIQHFLDEQGWVFRVARFTTVQNELINDGRHNGDRDIMKRTRGRSGGGAEEGTEGR